jgi:Xaa-Pro aminopeptidase
MPSPNLPPLIGPDELRKRQDRARETARFAGFDALLVVGRSFYDRPGDLAYLTGHFPPFPTTVFSATNRGMGHAIFLLPVTGEPALLTDPRKHRADLVAVDDVRAASDLGQAVIDLIRERGLTHGRVGLVGDDLLPAALDRQIRSELRDMSLEPDSSIIADLRRVKSPAEQELLRAAARCADAGLMAAVETIQRPGVTEREVCAAGIAACMLAGADFVRYFRVHSGPWSATGSRWPQAMDREILSGDVVVLDAIGAVGGYGFDVNRTTVKGTPSPDALDMLTTVERATEAALAACQPGKPVSEIAHAANSIMQSSRWREWAGSMMGHGIGLETVEEPYVMAGESMLLEPGMALCIEPGIFVPGEFGGVIEQEVIITATAAEIITPTPARLW